MLARILTGAVLGVDAYLVRVEVDVASGLPSFSTVGLAHGAVREGRERVTAALQNAGFQLPPKRITVNLAPADVRKEGSAFDLPIALGVLAASAQVPATQRLERFAFLGELGLDGELRPVPGAIAIALAARDAGFEGLVLPVASLGEAAVVEGLDVRGAASLAEVAAFVAGAKPLIRGAGGAETRGAPRYDCDMSDVRGQEHAKRALEVAAAGAHNLLMVGPPGSGKTMLARRLPTILPPPSLEESLEVTKIHSVSGLVPPGEGIVLARPFRAPHHTISDAGLIGGGSAPRPGEVSLSHHGVLFLDELPEFRRNVLEALRQPLEDGHVTVSRSALSLTFPARFMLAAAMNPCPCGHEGDEGHPCVCSAQAVQRYAARISGPLLDRIDLHVETAAVGYSDLAGGGTGDSSATVRARVVEARERQTKRLAGRGGVHANAHMRPRDLRELCRLDDAAEALLGTIASRLRLSARSYHRVLKVARTIADLGAAETISAVHLAEAAQYRPPRHLVDLPGKVGGARTTVAV